MRTTLRRPEWELRSTSLPRFAGSKSTITNRTSGASGASSTSCAPSSPRSPVEPSNSCPCSVFPICKSVFQGKTLRSSSTTLSEGSTNRFRATTL